jgi:hypothetical protein
VSFPRSAIFLTAQHAFKGKLPEWLRARRDDGETFDDIAIELREHGIVVTGETVRAWWIRIDAEQTEATA